MPLPAALAARLAKRGILAQKKNDSKREAKRKVHEEVIAEDYDSNVKDDLNQLDISQKFMGVCSCPNKYNIYHECSKKCKELWGKGLQPSEKYLKRQIRLLQRYPLPETWKAVFDPGSGQHYYWDWSSDLVSWLPPNHPKSQISQPASQLREELHMKAADQDDVSSDESGSEQEPMEVEDSENNKEYRHENRDKDKYSRNQSHRRHLKSDGKKDHTLDPMDPAAYSDIPRGKWSDGLAKNNEAKTGVDPTATGPLYQMRPYPSPGAVLRSNKNQKESDDE